jgi:alpha-D-ribose 1-methylphosphonate 5-triphosphate synthase subunit PhnH
MSAINNTFSIVYDTQSIYRLLLNLTARPGEIGRVALSASKIGLLPGAGDTALALAFMLLDSEVGFFVDMEQVPELAGMIRLRTLSWPATAEAADYIFADGTSAPGTWASTIRRGTLAEPEMGATVILQVDALEAGFASESTNDVQLTLSGPGIADVQHLRVGGLDRHWLTIRESWNEEYPMGVDLILFTPDGILAALPRTTKVKGV